MGMIQLRPYQLSAVERIREAIRAGKRSICLVAPTGSGKCVIGAHILHNAFQKGKMSLFIAHRRELIHQASNKLKAFGLDHGILMSDEPMSALAETQVASIQTFVSRIVKRMKISAPLADIVMVDECFPAGVLVDGRPIENIKVGDFIHSLDHRINKIVRSRVTRLFRSISHQKLIVLQYGETEIKCTANHPFFVKGKGYVSAQEICEGDLFGMRKSIPIFDSMAMANQEILFHPVQTHDNGANDDCYKQKICLESNEIKESDAIKEKSGQDEGNIIKDRTQTMYSRRQRNGCNESRESNCESDGYETSCNSPDKCTEESRNTDTLQTGCRRPNQEDLHRSGWAKSWNIEQEDSRCQKGQFLTWVRVDRISRDEQTSIDGVEVYNLEVEGTHNYFVNDVLVHNCHHSTSDSYLALKDIYPDSIFIGLTATPCRGDGRGLGKYFDVLIEVATPQELIDMGFLVDTKIVAPRLPDLKGVRTVRGDFEEKELQKRMEPMIGDLVRDWKQYASDRSTLVFAVTVAHSVWIKERFENHGISCEHVDAQTPMEKRDRIFDDFLNGRLQVLTNVGIATEGTDLPIASCAILARPTKSYGLYLQMAGRICRTHPGKSEALIIDHSGNVYRHGFPQDAGGWELDEKFVMTEKNQERLAKESNPITCRECFTVYSGQLHCPACNALPSKRGQNLSMEEGRLYHVERKRKKEPVEKWTMEQKADFYGQLKALELARGKKPGWAAHIYRERLTTWPNHPDIRHAPHRTPTPEVKSYVQSRQIAYARSRDRQAAR